MPAKVYYQPLQDGSSIEDQCKAMQKVLEASGALKCVDQHDMVALKLHVGEKNNTTHINPAVIRQVVDAVKAKEALPFLTETSTLYKGERENAVKHMLHAHNQGFGIDAVGAPFIMADGLLGDTEHEVAIPGILHQSVKVAREVVTADALLVLSHPTGHIAAGMGACLKNLGMGLASRMGKMRQHSAMKPEVLSETCRYCQKCLKWCPQEAIIEQEGKAFIQIEKCIGCGECLAMCRFDSIKYDWNAESGYMQKSIAEHAYGVVKDKKGKSFFINVLVDMTKDCDCFSVKQEKMIPDLGILASEDPVAVDMATVDLTKQAHGESIGEMAYRHHDAMVQVRHAAEIGLGSLNYELIKLS